ncbi:hypothetical protein VTO42DRAFT_7800 [Malbranchea cinnamomea]
MEAWFRENVLKQKIIVDTDRVHEVQWDRTNSVFADVLLRADEILPEESDQADDQDVRALDEEKQDQSIGIPVGPSSQAVRSASHTRKSPKSILYPVHKAMLLRSEFFRAMFSSGFREAQISDKLHITRVDCSPEVLEIVLTFLYTEKAEFSLDVAVDVLFAADLLLIERLKTKAAVVISSLGNGNMNKSKSVGLSRNSTTYQERKGPAQEVESNITKMEVQHEDEGEEEPVDIYEIMRAAWLTRVQRLEEFVARYLAYRLESHIDTPEFEQLVLESATRIQKRQETDSIELVDDIRYYLSERFRLRFEDSGLEEMMEENKQQIASLQNDAVSIAQIDPSSRDSETSKWSSKPASSTQSKTPEDEGVDVSGDEASIQNKAALNSGNVDVVIRTLDGEVAGDEFYRDAKNYQILLNKLDRLLERLGLDA